MNPDPGHWYSTTLNVWTLAGALVAAWTLVKTITQGWRLSFGRRRHLIAQLRKIAPGVRHDYVESLLGEPKWQSKMECTRIAAPDSVESEIKDEDRKVELTVRTWPLSWLGFLVTWSEDDAVVMYGITTTSWWFRPRMLINQSRIRLGKSPLAVLDRVEEHRAWLGNRRFGYVESHYFGNPDGYRHWYVGINDVGYNAMAPSPDSFDAEAEVDRMRPKARDAYRALAPINTVVISGVALYEELQNGSFFGISLGVNQDLVRLTQPDFYALESRFSRVRIRFRNWRWDRRLNRLGKKARAAI